MLGRDEQLNIHVKRIVLGTLRIILDISIFLLTHIFFIPFKVPIKGFCYAAIIIHFINILFELFHLIFQFLNDFKDD